MSYPASRPRFFNGQFLLEKDFTDQETFHLDHRDLHDRTLHFWGITEGLKVTIKGGDATTIVVAEGAALDATGRPIVLVAPKEQSAQGFAGQTCSVIISFNEEQTDPAPPTYTPGNTRFTQDPFIDLTTGVRSGDIVLATLSVDPAGNVVSVSALSRTYAGVRLPGIGGAGFDLRAVPDGASETKLSVEHFTPNDMTITPLVTVDATGKVGIGTTSPTATLEVGGQVKITGAAPAAGKILTSDSAGLASWQIVPPVLVSGPATSTATAIATFADATGKVLRSTGVTIDATDKLTAVNVQITGASPAVGKVLSSDATGNASWQTAAALSIASGPATSTLNGVSAFADATGKVLKSTTVTIDAANKLIAPSGALVSGTFTLQDTTQGAGKILISDVSGIASWQTTASQSLVSGPASATNTGVPTFNGTTGKVVQSTAVMIDAANKLTAAGLQITGGSPAAGKILSGTDGSGNSSWQTAAALSIASGPATSTVNGVSAFADATGKVLKSTTVTIDAANKLTAPSGALVSGTFTLQDTTQGANKVLVSDVSGNASWQTTASQSIASGPPTSTVNGVAAFVDATGKVLKSSTVTIDAANKLMAPSAQVNGIFTLQDGTQGGGKILSSDASGNASWQTSPNLSLVTGPASSTNTAVATFNGATGKIIQNTGVTIDVTNKLTAASVQVDFGQVSLSTGSSSLAITSGTSVAPRTYRVLDLGPTGTLAVVEVTSNVLKTTYTTDQTIPVPPNAVSMKVKIWGAGGNGANGSAASGPGGGGGYAFMQTPVKPGQVFQLTIGLPGQGGAPGACQVDSSANGVAGGGMSMFHELIAGQYFVKLVAGGGGGGSGGSSGQAGGIGGAAGTAGAGGPGDQGGQPGNNGAAGAGGAGSNNWNGGAGGNFVNPVASLASVGGYGGNGAQPTGGYGGPGGGGKGYGGGGGGSSGGSGSPGSSGGGGGGNFGPTTANGSGQLPGNNADPDRVAIYGYGGNGGYSKTPGSPGIAVVEFTLINNALRLEDNATADAVKAPSLLVRAANKTAGSGDGGDLMFQPGTSVGGSPGTIKFASSTPLTLAQTSASGAFLDLSGTSGTTPASCSITSWKNGHVHQGFLKISINGTINYVAYYSAPTAP